MTHLLRTSTLVPSHGPVGFGQGPGFDGRSGAAEVALLQELRQSLEDAHGTSEDTETKRVCVCALACLFRGWFLLLCFVAIIVQFCCA